ncbi:MAG TPA: hypothetical protein VKT77_14890 [Chthonomonadaceae bacterium]|nr:hypothetical protein [Chthonomonadaceae bacterium]
MPKLPVPVAVGVLVVALAVLGFVMYKSLVRPAGDSGDSNAITAQILQNNPKNAPQLPPDQQPGAMAVGAGKGKRMQSTR